MHISLSRYCRVRTCSRVCCHCGGGGHSPCAQPEWCLIRSKLSFDNPGSNQSCAPHNACTVVSQDDLARVMCAHVCIDCAGGHLLAPARAVAVLLAAGWLGNHMYFMLVTQLYEQPPNPRTLSAEQCQQAMHALKRIHDAGVLHGDVDNCANILITQVCVPPPPPPLPPRPGLSWHCNTRHV